MFTPNFVAQSPGSFGKGLQSSQSSNPLLPKTQSEKRNSSSQSSGRAAASSSMSSIFTEFFSLNHINATSSFISQSGGNNFPFAVAIEAYGIFQNAVQQLRIELGPASTQLHGDKSDPLAAARLSKGGGELQLLNCNLMGVGTSPVGNNSQLPPSSSPDGIVPKINNHQKNETSPLFGDEANLHTPLQWQSPRTMPHTSNGFMLTNMLHPPQLIVPTSACGFGCSQTTVSSSTATGHNSTIHTSVGTSIASSAAGLPAPLWPRDGRSPLDTSSVWRSNPSITIPATSPAQLPSSTANPSQTSVSSMQSSATNANTTMNSFLMGSHEAAAKATPKEPQSATIPLNPFGFMGGGMGSEQRTFSSPFGPLTKLPTVLSPNANVVNGPENSLAVTPSQRVNESILSPSGTRDPPPIINTMAAAVAATGAMYENAPESIQIKKLRQFISRLDSDEGSMGMSSNPFGSGAGSCFPHSASPATTGHSLPSLRRNVSSVAVPSNTSALPSNGAEFTSLGTFRNAENASGTLILNQNNTNSSFHRRAIATTSTITTRDGRSSLNNVNITSSLLAGTTTATSLGSLCTVGDRQSNGKATHVNPLPSPSKSDKSKLLYVLARKTIGSPALLPVAAYAIAARATPHFARIRQMLLLWCDSAIETAGLIIPNKLPSSESSWTPTSSSTTSNSHPALVGIGSLCGASKGGSVKGAKDATPTYAGQLSSKSRSSWGLESDPDFVALSNGIMTAATNNVKITQPQAALTVHSPPMGDFDAFAGSCAFGGSVNTAGVSTPQATLVYQATQPNEAVTKPSPGHLPLYLPRETSVIAPEAAESMLPSEDDPFGGTSHLEDSQRGSILLKPNLPSSNRFHESFSFGSRRKGSTSHISVAENSANKKPKEKSGGRRRRSLTPLQQADLRVILSDIVDRNQLPPLHVCERIIVESRDQMRLREANVVTLNSPCVVVGDIHGNMDDLRAIFKKCGGIAGIGSDWGDDNDNCHKKQINTKYLFLGDYVDRGSSSLQVALAVCCAKLLCPTSVYLIRGNHESKDINATYGFLNEVDAAFPMEKEGPNPSYTANNAKFMGSPLPSPQKIVDIAGPNNMMLSPLGSLMSKSKLELQKADPTGYSPSTNAHTEVRDPSVLTINNPVQLPNWGAYNHIRPLARYKSKHLSRRRRKQLSRGVGSCKSIPTHQHDRNNSNTLNSRSRTGIRDRNEHSHVKLLFATESENEASQHDNALWSLFNDMFRAIPLAALIDNNIFCVHGGLSPSCEYIETILAVDRFQADKNDMIMDLLWSDPSPHMGYATNRRGNGCLFGPDVTMAFIKKNNLRFICRAHQCVKEGYQWDHGDRVLTLFSAANYCNMSNKGAILFIDPVAPNTSTTMDTSTVAAGNSTRTRDTQASDDAFGDDDGEPSDVPCTIEGYNTPRKKMQKESQMISGPLCASPSVRGHDCPVSESSTFGSLSSGSRSAEVAGQHGLVPVPDFKEHPLCVSSHTQSKDFAAVSQVREETCPDKAQPPYQQPYDGIRFLTYDQRDIVSWINKCETIKPVTLMQNSPDLKKIPAHFW